MKKFLFLLILIIPLLFIGANAQRTYDMFDIYLQPNTMAEDGSISVAVRIRNIERVDVQNFDGISAVAFNLNVDATAFTIASEPISIDDNTLITDSGDITTHIIGDTLNFMFIDMSLGNRLIKRDGVLCYIKIRTRNPSRFFHSADVYPLTFVRDSVQVTTLSTFTNHIGIVPNVHVWDVDVGGEVWQKVLPPLRTPIAEEIRFNINDNMLIADGQEIDMDAVMFWSAYGDFVPIRFIAEAAGAGVQWRAVDRKVVIATPDNSIIEIIEGNDVMLINGEEMQMRAPAIIRRNRILIPFDSGAAMIFPTLASALD